MRATLDAPTPCDFDAADLLCAADFPAERVKWLWPERIPIGKVTLLVGDPGNGKSLVALDIASRVSRAAPWPDVPPQAQGLHSLGPPRLPGSVLILSAEDDLRDTIRPRLDAAGADPRRIFLLPSMVDLRNDLAKLRAAIDRRPACRLIIIDPVHAYVGPGDSHFHTIVRRVFEPLAKLAADKGLAVLAISHLRKHNGAALQRAAGSMGLVASARAVWTVCRDPVQPARHLFLPLKNNFTADTTGLAYTITSMPPLPLAGEGQGEGPSAPAIDWHSGPVTTSAAEALRPLKKSRGPQPAELNAAVAWLRDQLAKSPQAASLISLAGEQAGFCPRTLRRRLARARRRNHEEGQAIWRVGLDSATPRYHPAWRTRPTGKLVPYIGNLSPFGKHECFSSRSLSPFTERRRE